MLLSKNKIKYIHSLEQKKNRKAEGVFVAEGFKSVGDLLDAGYKAQMIVATDEWEAPQSLPRDVEMYRVTDEELRKASLLLHPQQVLGVFQIPVGSDASLEILPSEQLCLCLDGVQDPGNLGTIIRTADWFGIRHIFCSQMTADAYNPKVVQATMGSIARVKVHYLDLKTFIKGLDADVPIYGTLLDGDDLYDAELENHGLVVMGNEGNGISGEIREMLTSHLLIPSYPKDSDTAESLNVAIATSIICAEFRRRG